MPFVTGPALSLSKRLHIGAFRLHFKSYCTLIQDLRSHLGTVDKDNACISFGFVIAEDPFMLRLLRA